MGVRLGLRLHVPEPQSRPGDRPDFHEADLPAAVGSAAGSR
jgi:2-oxoisovalerate dehydrogenase E1 alpha subunit N terminal